MVLDLTITLGNVASMAGTGVAVYTAYTAARRDADRKAAEIGERLVRLETQVNDLWERRHIGAKR